MFLLPHPYKGSVHFDAVAMQAPLTRLNIARYYYSLLTINGKHGLQLLVVVL